MHDVSTMTSLEHDDSIEIISCQTSSLHDAATAATAGFTNLQVVTPTSIDASVHTKMLPTMKATEKQTKKQKRIARVVGLVAGILILASFVLVGVTLSMADHIDEMVRKKNGYYSTARPVLPPAIPPNPTPTPLPQLKASMLVFNTTGAG